MSTESEIVPIVTSKRVVGQVKWFNNKAGYGFITTNDESKKDIFTHYSNIQVDNTQYKYLIQGEYVEFEMSSSNNEKHEIQATNITGIQKGKLMCETRFTNKSLKTQSSGPRRPRARKETGKSSSSKTDEDDGFTKV